MDDGYGAPEPLDGIVMAEVLLKVPLPPGASPPSVKAKLAVPRSAEPSSRWSVATRGPPQVPAAVSVKLRLTAGPPATRTPYDCGLLGETTPPVGRSVASRLVVLPVPV